MTNLADTSIPSWVIDPTPTEPDTTGRSYLLLGVGAAARPTLQRWEAEIGADHVDLMLDADVDKVREVLVHKLKAARVGIRLRIAGSAGACLKLRGVALTHGLEDDEISAFPVGVGPLEVFCTHCRAVSGAHVDVGGTVPCDGCGRTLVVYHHVTRRSGQFMGFMADAEAAS
jgi:hypothetical protein